VSYNADTIDIVASDGLSIDEDGWLKLRRSVKREDRPELCVLDEDSDDFVFSNSKMFPKFMRWTGEGSGYSWDTFISKVLPAFDGSCDLVVCFEGGDSYQGIRLRDHKVTIHKVLMILGEETK